VARVRISNQIVRSHARIARDLSGSIAEISARFGEFLRSMQKISAPLQKFQATIRSKKRRKRKIHPTLGKDKPTERLDQETGNKKAASPAARNVLQSPFQVAGYAAKGSG
jgi:hypothetical protein